MKQDIRYIPNKCGAGVLKEHCADEAETRDVLPFHTGIPGYAPTPLRSLSALARKAGVASFHLKDESARFGLNAFKALGGSYAIAQHLCRELGIPCGPETFALLRSEKYAPSVCGRTFVTATDGNHGRGVAWTAQTLGCRAIVYLPKGSAEERLRNILAHGAQAEITDLNYDDAVRLAAQKAAENGWTLVQDTSLPGYTDIPRDILRGYTTMAAETARQLSGQPKPTHLFLQAGVGSMAGAVAGYFRSLWGAECPGIIVVEPDRADCLFRTAEANDGTLHTVSGDMDSMMAGLCCGEPCPIGWDILKECAAGFISCSDRYAALGMRLLARPFGDDPAVVSGESGAVTAGVAAALCLDPALSDLRGAIGLNADSRILVFSTEGATDLSNYRRVLAEADDIL